MERLIIELPKKANGVKSKLLELINSLHLNYEIMDEVSYDEEYVKSIEKARKDFKEGKSTPIDQDLIDSLRT